LAEEGKDLCSA